MAKCTVPSMTFKSDPNTGLYSSSSGKLSIAVSGESFDLYATMEKAEIMDKLVEDYPEIKEAYEKEKIIRKLKGTTNGQ